LIGKGLQQLHIVRVERAWLLSRHADKADQHPLGHQRHGEHAAKTAQTSNVADMWRPLLCIGALHDFALAERLLRVLTTANGTERKSVWRREFCTPHKKGWWGAASPSTVRLFPQYARERRGDRATPDNQGGLAHVDGMALPIESCEHDRS